MEKVDLAIIGAGSAGLSAAIYGARGGLKTVVFESGVVGGQIVLTNEIENYPGYEEIMSGFELMCKMRMQAERFGAEIIEETVEKIIIEHDEKIIITADNTYLSKTVAFATGASPRKLGVPGEERLMSKGVSYCATCDAALYKGKTVAMIGGGDSAIEEAIFLTKFAEKVFIIHRRDELRAVHSIQERAFNNSKIEFIFDTIVEEIKGDKKVESLLLHNKKNNNSFEINVDGVFVYVGIVPNNELIKDLLELDTQGFVITNEDMETSIPGFYVIGDIRKKTLRQVVTATSDGAIAGFLAEKYIAEK